MPNNRKSSYIREQTTLGSQLGVSSNGRPSSGVSPESFLCISFCASACKSQCASKCASNCSSNCGSACASRCSAQCASKCASMCYGFGADEMNKKEEISVEDIIL